MMPMRDQVDALDHQSPAAVATTVALDGPNGTLTPQLLDRLRAAVNAAQVNPDLRMLVLTGGSGQVFCSGMDVEAVGADRAALAHQAGWMYDLLSGLRQSRLLVVCAVD